MSKIATYRESVKLDTAQRVQEIQDQAIAIANASEQISRLNQSLQALPENTANRILPAVQSLNVMVKTTNQTLSKLQSTLTQIEAQKQEHESIISLLEYQTSKLEAKAHEMLEQHQQRSQKDLLKLAAMSAAGAAILSLAVTLSALSFWPQPQAQQAAIGQRVLNALDKTDQRTRDWLNFNFVQQK